MSKIILALLVLPFCVSVNVADELSQPESIILIKSKKSKRSKKAKAPKPSTSKLGLTAYESEHYRLETDVSKVQAEAFVILLEAEWIELTEFFGAAPKLRKGQKLQVNFLTTEDQFQNKMLEDGVKDRPDSGGYCINNTAYLYVQRSVYNTRQLFLHEVMHQFHELAVCKGASIENKWYAEGIVEYFTRHCWDTEKLEMGVVPLLTRSKFPESALEMFSKSGFKLANMIDGKTSGERSVMWALVRYLQLSKDKKYMKGWKSLRTKLDRGADSKNVFRKYIDKPEVLQPKILEWLKTQQEPFIEVWGAWEPTSSNCISGYSSSMAVMASTSDLEEISVTVKPDSETNWGCGFLLDYVDTDNFSLGYIRSDGIFKIKVVTDGNWDTVSKSNYTKSKKNIYVMKADRTKAGKVNFIVNDKVIDSIQPRSKKMGLYTDECKIDFEELEWVNS